VSSGQGGIDCPPDCSTMLPNGTEDTLTATPASGFGFSGWSGGGCSGTAPCAVTLDADKTVTATFTANPPPPPAPSNQFTIGELDGKRLSLSVASAGQVSVNDAAAQTAGTSAIAAAKKRLKPASASGGPGVIEVTLKLTKLGKRKLREKGKVRVNARITFTPAGGTANSQTQRLKIRR